MAVAAVRDHDELGCAQAAVEKYRVAVRGEGQGIVGIAFQYAAQIGDDRNPWRRLGRGVQGADDGHARRGKDAAFHYRGPADCHGPILTSRARTFCRGLFIADFAPI